MNLKAINTYVNLRDIKCIMVIQNSFSKVYGVEISYLAPTDSKLTINCNSLKEAQEMQEYLSEKAAEIQNKCNK